MAENSAAEEAPAKKGKLKLIIMLVLVIVLAIVLSVVGTLWFLGGSLPGMAGDDDPSAEEPAEEVFVPSTYVELDKALVTTVQAVGRQRYAQVHLSLEAKDPQALAAAELHMPLIRSQLVTVLGSSQFNELQTPEGRRALAEQMSSTVNQVLEQEGEPAIERVLFRNFVVQ